MSSEKKLAYSVIQYLKRKCASCSNSDQKESLEVAVECLENALEVDSNASHLNVNHTLEHIFKEFLEKQGSSDKIPTEEEKAEGERLKNEGNELFKQNNLLEALECYNKAITVDPTNPKFYNNRATVYMKLQDFDQAISDCKSALKLDPSYASAHGRLGSIYLTKNKFQEAVDCYKKAVELDPTSTTNRDNHKLAEQKLRESLGSSANASPSLGGFDMGFLFRNPMLVNMATQAMQDPNMQQILSSLMSGNMQQVQGMDSLLEVGQRLAQQMQSNNPELVEQLRRQMNPNPGNQTGNNGSQGDSL